MVLCPWLNSAISALATIGEILVSDPGGFEVEKGVVSVSLTAGPGSDWIVSVLLAVSGSEEAGRRGKEDTVAAAGRLRSL